MSAFSPTASGFRIMFRRPAISFAEIAWRWSFATAAWFLSGAFLVAYADSLPVDAVDRLLLGTQQPTLIWRALQRIFHGSALRFTESGILLAALIVLAWIVLASLGRVATGRAIVEELRIARVGSGLVSSLLTLNFLRAAAMLAAGVAIFGATFIASGVWASTHLSVTAVSRLWLLLLFLVWLAWVILNWLLSTASVFVISEAVGPWDAIAATVRWCQKRLGGIVAASFWFGILHGAAFVAAYLAGFTVLGIAQLLGPGLTLFFELSIMAAYCGIADFLYIGRLAAYFSIAHEDELSVLSREEEPIRGPGNFAIDQSELILSDVPLPAT
jgi:hypothetical protein